MPLKLQPGDKVRFLSPASTPDKEDVLRRAAIFESWGLKVDFGQHAFNKIAYLAGTDEQRLSDFNAALRDPTIRAIVATRGGKGSYRIADQIDFAAAARDPKLVVGFSDITALHLSLWHQCRLPGIHGALAEGENGQISEASIACLHQVMMTADEVIIQARSDEATAKVTTEGTARGTLIGGNLTMIATTAGWALPDLRGSILLIEETNSTLGQVDRVLTMLRKSGRLTNLAGLALGRFTEFEASGPWTITDLLREHLHPLNVPILGGLPLGHGHSPLCVPLGSEAYLDATAGALRVEAATKQRH